MCQKVSNYELRLLLKVLDIPTSIMTTVCRKRFLLVKIIPNINTSWIQTITYAIMTSRAHPGPSLPPILAQARPHQVWKLQTQSSMIVKNTPTSTCAQFDPREQMDNDK